MHKAIALGATGNLQGSVKFYSLDTGRILKRRSFMPFPMPDCIIAKVNRIGAKEKQGRSFQFLNRQAEQNHTSGQTKFLKTTQNFKAC
jgi:hypothetical protein